MLTNVSVFDIFFLLIGIVVPLMGGVWAGVKWADRKKESSDKQITIIRQQIIEGHRSLADDLSRLRTETTAQIGALDLKSAERYATWQSFKEFKDDLKSDINSRFDRHERTTSENFDRLFREIAKMKEQN